jgi:hypothetical protein
MIKIAIKGNLKTPILIHSLRQAQILISEIPVLAGIPAVKILPPFNLNFPGPTLSRGVGGPVRMLDEWA